MTCKISKISKADIKSFFARISLRDPTPLRNELLKYTQKSCSDTLASCYTWNGDLKAELQTTEKWIAVTSPYDFFKHLIDIDYKQIWVVAKCLASYSTEKILASVNLKSSIQCKRLPTLQQQTTRSKIHK